MLTEAFINPANGPITTENQGQYQDTIKETDDDATVQANATHFVKNQNQMTGTMKSDMHSLQHKESARETQQDGRMHDTMNTDLIRDVALTPQNPLREEEKEDKIVVMENGQAQLQQKPDLQQPSSVEAEAVEQEEETKVEQQPQPQKNLDIDKVNLLVKIVKSSTDATKPVGPNQNSDGVNDHASEKFSQYSPIKMTDIEEAESSNNKSQKRMRNNSNTGGQLLQLVEMENETSPEKQQQQQNEE